MNKEDYLQRLRQALDGLPVDQIDEIIADYAAHFDESAAHGRSEHETAQALGDPQLLAREHLSDSYYGEWRQRKRPSGLLKWLLVSAGLLFLLPYIGILFPIVAGALLLMLAAALIGGALLLPWLSTIIGAALIAALILVLLRRGTFDRFGLRLNENDEDIIEREIEWHPSNSMTVSLPAEVHWKPALTPHAVIRGKARLLEHVKLDSQSLQGRFKWRPFDSNHLHIDLEGPAIEHWTLVGSGAIHLHNVAQHALRLRLTGSGDIRAEGRSENVAISVTGTGDVDTGKLEQLHTTVELTGNGDATVAPRESADLSIAGSGDITLLTDPPQLRTTISGGGDIRRVSRKY